MPRLSRFCLAVLVPSALGLGGCAYLPFGDDDAEAVQQAAAEVAAIAVTVAGVEGELASNIEHSVTIGRRLCNTPRAYLNALSAQAENEAKEAARALGYYQTSVAANVQQGADCPSVTLQVSAGPRTVVNELDIELHGAAADDAEFERQLANAPLRRGEGLDHRHYSATKALIESLALERGYLDGRFNRHVLRVDPAKNSAAIELSYDSGQRYGLGPIRIKQDPEFIDEDLVRRFLDYSPGQAYQAAVVPRFYQALEANDYFSEVEVTPQLSQPEAGVIPLEIALTARPKHKFSAAIGASTDELIRTKFGYVNRRVNRRGHRFDADLKASAIEQSLGARYRIPRQHPTDEWLTFQAGVRREDVDSFKTTEAQFGVSETKRRPWGIMETRFLNFNRQVFDVGATVEQTTSLLMPGVSWNKVTANDPLYPTRGYSAKVELRGASDQVLSDVSFARAQAKINFAYGLPWRMRALARTEIGALWSSNFSELPPSERFFAGGDSSIRGYDIDALGPLDGFGEVIGGRYLGIASFELEKTLVGLWGLALFVDAGNAFGGDGKSDGVKTGVGLGLRWRSPLGPVRVDLARPLDGRETVRLHLRIGPDL